MSPFPVVNPETQHGKPVVSGTRVPIAVVVGSLARGMSYDQISSDYGVTLEQIQQCLGYAASLVEAETLLPMSQTG
jgi:uncharacterized protein (DUF433 family)